MKKSNKLHSLLKAVSIVGIYQTVEVNSARVYRCIFSFSPFSFMQMVITGKLISLRGVSLSRDGEIKALHYAGITGEDKPISEHMSLSFQINISLQIRPVKSCICFWIAPEPIICDQHRLKPGQSFGCLSEFHGSVQNLDQVFSTYMADIPCILYYLGSFPIFLPHCCMVETYS